MLAAIAGGGVKAAGAEIPLLGSTIRQVLLAGLGIALIVISAFVDFAPEPAAEDLHEPDPRPSPLPRLHAVRFIARRARDGDDLLSIIGHLVATRRIAVLWGPGGVGKSTLAAEAARRWKEQTGGLVLYVNTERLSEATIGAMLDDLAGQLGDVELRKLQLEDRLRQITGILSSVPAALLVIDSCEYFDHGSRRLLNELTDRLECAAILTTRDRLDTGTHVPVDTLRPDESHAYVRELLRSVGNPSAFESLSIDEVARAADGNPQVLAWIVGQIDLAEAPDRVLSQLARASGSAAERVLDTSLALPQLGKDGRTDCSRLPSSWQALRMKRSNALPAFRIRARLRTSSSD